MLVSIFLARFFGLYLMIAGIFYLVRKTYIQKISKEIFSPPLILISGSISLILGLAIVILHSTWKADWRILVTLLGYLSLLKGLFRLFVDGETIKKWGSNWLSGNKPLYIGFFCLIIGLFLVYKGFYIG